MTQHIHILGICGTFMGSIAQLAKSLGYKVTGSDLNVYPPMSTQLENAGITLTEGFEPSSLLPKPDLVIVGNVVSRGNPAMEWILNEGVPYISGPQWLAENYLHDKWVLAVSGTHGKTTTTSMLAWILEYAGFKPGFLIGGVPSNFDVSARLGESDFFVIEADEYDTAFFDKRAKFVHYRPRTLVIGNMEFDHADIYPDLASIQKQFHHLLRMLPSDGLLITPAATGAIDDTLKMGFWSQHQTFSAHNAPVKGVVSWRYALQQDDGGHFKVFFGGESEGRDCGEVRWTLTGKHNVENALSAIAAARHIGILPSVAAQALCEFEGVKRRMELIASHSNIKLYDDFAHHPTAIKTTLEGLRNKVGKERIIAVIEPRSNTMKMGVHNMKLADSAVDADKVYWFDGSKDDELTALLDRPENKRYVLTSLDTLQATLQSEIDGADGGVHAAVHIVVMSNGGFAGIHNALSNYIKEAP